MAALWFIVNCFTTVAFLTASAYILSDQLSNYGDSNYDDYYYYYNGDEKQKEELDFEAEMAVTSRAMAFSALWVAVLALLLAIFGTVVLGWQSPTGLYYTCCSPQVHRTTPLALGSFIGCLMMFANMTLVCSVLFGEFQVRGSLLRRLVECFTVR